MRGAFVKSVGVTATQKQFWRPIRYFHHSEQICRTLPERPEKYNIKKLPSYFYYESSLIHKKINL